MEVLGKSLVVSLEGVGRVEMWEMTISTRKADDILAEMLILECGFVPNLFLDLLSKLLDFFPAKLKICSKDAFKICVHLKFLYDVHNFTIDGNLSGKINKDMCNTVKVVYLHNY